MIREINFEADLYNYINDSGQSNNEINGLNKVNIFVGANNSGKSRFIRKLLMENYHSKIQGLSNIGNMEDCNKAITQVRDQLTQIINKYRAKGADVSSTIDIENILKEMKTAGAAEQHKANINNLAILKQLIDNSDLDDSIRSEMNDFFKRLVKKLGVIPYATIIFKDYRAVYIPIMRGLRPLVQVDPKNIKGKSTPYSDSNCFEERVIFDHFCDTKQKKSILSSMSSGGEYEILKKTFVSDFKFTIFTGLNLYDEIKKMLLGTHEERRFIKEYEDFLKLNFFYDQSITLIPRASDDVLYIKIGDQEERPIYDLGDGLQTIIISTFPAFRYREEKLLLFVEEPELTLHPGMQRKLLDAYCNFDNIQVFITTHSNHFLDLTLDFNDMCSIFSFEKVSDKEFQIKNVTPNKEVLDLLGVRSSSVFLSNCVIWVEGISDRLYVRKFLELYNLKYESELRYEEDKHYSIVEYGGGNITHFNFDDKSSEETTINVHSIAKNNFVIADNDKRKYKETTLNKKDAKAMRLKELSENLGGNFFAEQIEIENLIPYSVYKKYFENLPVSQNRQWEFKDKKLNETTFLKDLQDMKIGKVLKKYFISLKDGVADSSSFTNNDISCIGNKKDIAIKLIDVIEKEQISFDQLPVTTQRLTKRLYEFIKGNNN